LREIHDPSADAWLTELSKSENRALAEAATRELEGRRMVRENEAPAQKIQSPKP